MALPTGKSSSALTSRNSFQPTLPSLSDPSSFPVAGPWPDSCWVSKLFPWLGVTASQRKSSWQKPPDCCAVIIPAGASWKGVEQEQHPSTALAPSPAAWWAPGLKKSRMATQITNPWTTPGEEPHVWNWIPWQIFFLAWHNSISLSPKHSQPPPLTKLFSQNVKRK